MEPGYRTREFRDDDWASWSDVRSRSGIPGSRTTADALRSQTLRLEEGSNLHRRFVVEETAGHRGVGFALLYREPVDADPAAAWVSAIVDPGHRTRGIGSALFDATADAAERSGVRTLLCRVAVEPPAGTEFLARRGFAERRRSSESVLELAEASVLEPGELARLAAQRGVAVTSWAAASRNDPHAEEKVHALIQAAGADVPRVGRSSSLPLDQFRRWVVHNPAVPGEGVFLAMDGAEYVGISYGNYVEGDPGAFFQQFTGTRREYRGRGIAGLLKLHLVAFAAQHGVERIRTVNDEENAPMLAINRTLGFRPSVTWAYLVRSR